ncbi:hypothetical protein L5F24_01865, partial [Aliarcobacter butzleri]|nr:hypothetical protein [Aliarcobacter butzleri]
FNVIISICRWVIFNQKSGSNFNQNFQKAIDGWNHSVAFTLNTYKNNIRISDNAAERVQANCVRCHSGVSETVQKNASSYHNKGNFDKDRKCWECHKYVPHGKVRSLISTPYSLGIKEHLK